MNIEVLIEKNEPYNVGIISLIIFFRGVETTNQIV